MGKSQKAKLCSLQCSQLTTDKWLPIPVISLNPIIERFIDGSFELPASRSAIIKNMSYSLQYMEYLDESLSQLRLTGVLTTMVFKTGVITAMGFVEAFLYCLIHKHGRSSLDEWENIKGSWSSQVLPDTAPEQRRVTYLQTKKKEPRAKKMNLSSMIDICFSKKLLPDPFKKEEFQKLRDLRNTVHLHGDGEEYDAMRTDWWNFNLAEYELGKAVVLVLLVEFFALKEDEREKFAFLFPKPKPQPRSNDDF